MKDRAWNCRFHPFNWWHEVGCPHVDWTPEQLGDAERMESQFAEMKGALKCT